MVKSRESFETSLWTLRQRSSHSRQKEASSVSLRAYGQRDPLIEYRREGLMRFRQLEENIRATVIDALPRMMSSDEARIRAEEERTRAALFSPGKEESAQAPLVKTSGPGRNAFVTVKK